MARLRHIAAAPPINAARPRLRFAWPPPLLLLFYLGLLLEPNCYRARARNLGGLPLDIAHFASGVSHKRSLLQVEEAASGADASATAAAAGFSSAGAVLVRTAAQLAAAIADPAVQVAVLSGSVALTEADWAPVAQPVVEVRRNLTLLGAYTAPAAWPTLNLGYTANVDGVGSVKSAKVRVAPGCTLTFRRLVLTDGRELPQFLFMGLDIFAQSPTPNSTLASSWPLVSVRDAALWQRTCLPLSAKALPGRTIPRPVFLPGAQNSTGTSVPLPPDCVNDATAPPMMRCWPARGLYRDMAVYAYDADAYDRQMPAGYAMYLINVTFWCGILMTDDCVAANGGYLACYYSLFPYSRNARGSSPSPAATGNLTSVGGGGSVGATALVAGTQPAAGSGDGGSSSSQSILAPVLCGVLAGLIGVALCAGLIWAFVSYRRRRTQQREKGSSSDSTASTPHVQQQLLVDTGPGGTNHGPPFPASDAAFAVNGCGSSHGLLVSSVAHNNRGETVAGTSGKLAYKSTTDSDALSMLVSGTYVMGSPFVDTSGRAGGMSPGMVTTAQMRVSKQLDTASSMGMRTAGTIDLVDEDERALVPVTPLTPFQSHIPLDVKLGSGGGEVRLLPITLGKGACGRVVEGMWCGRRVAVKLLHRGLFHAAAAIAGPGLKDGLEGAQAPVCSCAPVTSTPGGRAHGGELGNGQAEAAGAVAEGGLLSVGVLSRVAEDKRTGLAARSIPTSNFTLGESYMQPTVVGHSTSPEAAQAPASTVAESEAEAPPPGPAMAALLALAAAEVPVALSMAPWWLGSFDEATNGASAAAAGTQPASAAAGGSSKRADHGAAAPEPAAVVDEQAVSADREQQQQLQQLQQLDQSLDPPQLSDTSPESLMSISVLAVGKNQSLARRPVSPSTRHKQSLPPPAKAAEAAQAIMSTISDVGPQGMSSQAVGTGGVQAEPGLPDASVLDAASKAAAAARVQAAARWRETLTHGGAVRRTIAQEVEVLARLQHPNIVQLLAANLNPACPCLVVELMDTSLHKLLYGNDGGWDAVVKPALLSLPTVLHIALQVARALSYLHPTIIHRDLKPGNVLISDAGSASPVVKIADFGLSRLQDTVLITAHVDVGTTPYMAPEALDARNCIITHHSDMYSYGIMLYEMLAGARPWRGLNMLQVAVAVCEKKARPRLEDVSEARCPAALRALVSQCWDPVPERRPSAAEVAKQLAIMLAQLEQAQVSR